MDTVIPVTNQMTPLRNPLFDGAVTAEQLTAGIELLTVDLLRKEFEVTRVTSIEKRSNILIIWGKYLRVFFDRQHGEMPPYLYPDSMGIRPGFYGEWEPGTFSVIPTEETVPMVHDLLVAKGRRYSYMASQLQTMYPQYFR